MIMKIVLIVHMGTAVSNTRQFFFIDIIDDILSKKVVHVNTLQHRHILYRTNCCFQLNGLKIKYSVWNTI